MSQPIHITPEVLHATAADHDEVVNHLEAARDKAGDILAAVESYGPIMHQVRSAVSDVLADRDTALAEHAARHRNTAEELRRAAAIYLSTDEQNAAGIEHVRPTT